MGARSLVRIGSVVMAASVAGLIYWNWEPAGADPQGTADNAPALAMPEGDRELTALTEAVRITQSHNGRDQLTIWADRLVDYEDGWNNWAGIRVLIHGNDPTPDDDVLVIGERMRTTGEVGEFDEVRVLGEVTVTLPGEGQFTTRRLDYDAVTGVVSNCNRNTLTNAGLEVRADCLFFKTAGDVSTGDQVVAEQLRMWGNLVLAAVPGTDRMPAGLRGSAGELRFRPGGETVELSGVPRLELEQASIRGDEIVLDVGEDVDSLRAVHVTGNGRVRYVPGTPSEDEGAQADNAESLGDGQVDQEGDLVADPGPALQEQGDEAAYMLRGPDVDVEFRSGSVRAIVIEGSPELGARITLPGTGRLDARRLAVRPRSVGIEAEATGGVSWQGAGGVGLLRELVSHEVTMRARGGGLERVDAAGAVRAEMATADGSVRQVTAPRLVAQWNEEGLQSVRFAEGVEFDADGRQITALSATYSGSSGAWTLDSEPRLVSPQDGLGLTAERIRLSPTGVDGLGDVVATVGGPYLLAGAALFGDVPEVSARCGRALLSDDGQLVLRESVEIVWEAQSLVTGELRLEQDPGRLRARSGVELVAVDGDGDDEGFITVTAENLLVEEGSDEIRLAGAARLIQGERSIEAGNLAVLVDAAGNWQQVLAEDQVRLQDGQGIATADSMVYELDTREVLLRGTDVTPATFEYDGIQYRSTEALRVRYEDEQVVIESTQDGRTQTNVVERDTDVIGALP